MLKLSEKANEQTGTKILLDAITNDKIHLARFILDALDGKIINARTERAQTPLISSVLLPDTQMRSKFMKLLLQRKADVNCQDETGRTALSYACERGYLDAVKILVQNNADPELVDMWGNTALIYAAVTGHSPVVEFLVRAFKRLGLNIDRPNRVGNSAVEVAKYLGHKDCFLALTSNAKKPHANETCNWKEPPQGQSHDNICEERLEKKLSNSLIVRDKQDNHVFPSIQTRSAFTANEALDIGGLDRKKSPTFGNQSGSMDSIDEADGESGSSPDCQGLVFSSVLTPRPRLRSLSVQYASTNQKQGENKNNIHPYLPPLSQTSDLRISAINSTNPNKNKQRSVGLTCLDTTVPISSSFSSSLGILLTPIAAAKVGKKETEDEKPKKAAFDSGVRRFHESYYLKRCSLPTSTLTPAPPDRLMLPLFKPKSLPRNIPATITDCSNTVSPTASTTFTVLGNKLFRRFTFPELKKTAKDLQGNECADASGGSPESVMRGLPRSETFPMSKNHPQVGSKPSIDSISAVKCEFEFHFKTTSS
ncbi:ANR63 protein, partial [Atractosteus spatula]|nr:ANR63 protein [Atractosteus spatula]